MTSRAYFDFETRSTVDLNEKGHEAYVNSPHTQAICLAYAFGDGPVQLWKRNESVPVSLVEHINAGGELVAHNAVFDFAILKKVFGVGVPLSQRVCTMAKCAMNNVPQSLKHAAEFLKLAQQKMALSAVTFNRLRTGKVMPADLGCGEGSVLWFERLDAMEALYGYCKQDVETCRAIDKALPDLPARERLVWALDQQINARGMAIDIPFVRKVSAIADAYRGTLDGKMNTLTNGVVDACTKRDRLLAWLNGFGLNLESLDKHCVEKALELPRIPVVCKTALEFRRDSAKSSTSKLQAILDEVGEDGRLRHQLRYHGAAPGRWSGRGAQPQNFPRLDEEKSPAYFDALQNGKEIDNPLAAISKTLRYVIVAQEGNELAGGDFSSIEARCLAWEAGQNDILDVFRSGQDVYLHTASKIYKRHITKEDKQERTIGKVATLALGYQGGVGAFDNMARIYGLDLPKDEKIRIKDLWRDSNPAIVKYWYDVNNAAVWACKKPGNNYPVGPKERRVTFRMDGTTLKGRLPSGRVIYFQKAGHKRVFKFGEMQDEVSYWGKESGKKAWHEVHMYGGKWAENITQAVARDCLVDVMFELEKHGFTIVSTVHDEVLCEVKVGGWDKELFHNILVKPPTWAPDLPMGASVWSDRRYSKC